MDVRHTDNVDDEPTRLAQAGAKKARALETLSAAPSYDSSAPLLGTLIPNSGNSELQQQQATSGIEEAPPPLPAWVAVVLITLFLLPLFIIIGLMAALIFSEIDPLGFSFLAFLLLFSSALSVFAISFLAWMMSGPLLKFYDMIGVPTDKLHPKRDVLSGILVFSFGCLVTYLIFYGTAWVWASSRAVADLIDKHGVWNDFQAKVDLPDALALLTRCLRDAVPNRYATVEDFSTCLKDIGVPSS